MNTNIWLKVNNTWTQSKRLLSTDDLVSPAFTGVPTAPTAALGTSNSQIATTSFVMDNIYDQISTKVRIRVPSTGSGSHYIKIATMPNTASVSSGCKHLTFILSGTGNFGVNYYGTYLINMSARGAIRIQIQSLLPLNGTYELFHYIENGNQVDLWYQTTSYCANFSVIPLAYSDWSASNMCGKLTNWQDTAPANLNRVSVMELYTRDKAQSILYGTTSPSTSQGKDGDIYIQY